MPGLDVDGAAGPGRHLDGGPGRGERERSRARGKGVEPEERALDGLARFTAADGVVEVWMAREQADDAVQPAEQHLAAAQVTHPLHPEPQGLDLGQQRPGTDVDQVAGQVEGQPAVPEQPRLQARRVGHGDDEHPAGGDERRRVAQRPDRPPQVLKRMPEDHRGPGAGHLLEVDCAHVRAGAGRVGIDAGGFPAVPQEGPDERPVAGPHVEHRPRRQNPVQAGGQRRPGAPQHRVADTGEPARLGPVPGRVCAGELPVARPRRRGRHPAARAQDPAGPALVTIAEPSPAPRALLGGRPHSVRVGDGGADLSARTACIRARRRAGSWLHQRQMNQPLTVIWPGLHTARLRPTT